MKKQTIGFLSVAFAGLAFGAQTMTSATFDLDTAPVSTVYAPCEINYSPSWVDGVDGSGAAVAIYAVAHVGQEQPVTTLVYRAAADAKGTYDYTPAEDAADAVRLVLAVEKGGETLGVLAHDVAFGTSATLAGVSADSRANAMQEIANATGKIPFAYDVAWADGAATMRVDWVNRTRAKRGPVVVTTNVVAAAFSGTGTSEWTVPNEDGFDKLLLTFLDSSGNPIGEPLESPWFEKYVPLGLLLMIR